MLATIAASEAAPPVPLGATPTPYTKVVATGRFDHGREALLGLEVRGTTLGAHLLVPLLRDGAPPLLVDRGWVPIERDRAVDHPEGEVSVTGYVRPADERDWNSPKDDPAGPALLHPRHRGDRRGARPAAAGALRPGGAGAAGDAGHAPAGGADHPAAAEQPASRLCHHLVRAGGGAGRRVVAFMLRKRS